MNKYLKTEEGYYLLQENNRRILLENQSIVPTLNTLSIDLVEFCFKPGFGDKYEDKLTRYDDNLYVKQSTRYDQNLYLKKSTGFTDNYSDKNTRYDENLYQKQNTVFSDKYNEC